MSWQLCARTWGISNPPGLSRLICANTSSRSPPASLRLLALKMFAPQTLSVSIEPLGAEHLAVLDQQFHGRLDGGALRTVEHPPLVVGQSHHDRLPRDASALAGTSPPRLGERPAGHCLRPDPRADGKNSTPPSTMKTSGA